MLTRERIFDMIAQLSEEDFKVVSRIVEGLAATPKPVLSATEFARQNTPIKPPRSPLAKQFGALLQQPINASDYDQMLKKNLYTRLSDLMAWINQPTPATEPSTPVTTAPQNPTNTH
jgi:hypothetical protein